MVLGLEDAESVGTAAEQVLAAGPEGSLVLVERMAEPGLELFVAAHRDGVVPVLVMGLGGVWAEVLDDVAVIPLPADADRIEAALLALRAAPVLTGARGGEPYALRAAAELGARVGELLVRTGPVARRAQPGAARSWGRRHGGRRRRRHPQVVGARDQVS